MRCDRLATGDREEPRSQRADLGSRPDCAPDGKERILNGVLRGGLTSDPRAVTQQRRLIAPDGHIDSGLAPGAALLEESRVTLLAASTPPVRQIAPALGTVGHAG